MGGLQAQVPTNGRDAAMQMTRTARTPAVTALSGTRKAAVVVMALGEETARPLLQSLSDEDVQKISQEIASLGVVPPAVVAEVLSEFYTMMERQQMIVRGGTDRARRLLTGAFGRHRADEMIGMLKRSQLASSRDLAALESMDPQQLSKFMAGEQAQTIALVLAHLEPEKGSAVLMHLNAEMRVAVLQRMAEMQQFSPEMAHTVARVLRRRMEGLGTSGRKSYAGCKAVADMLNRLDQTRCKSLLDEVEQRAPKLAIGIRDLMFTFEDLLTVPEQSVREIVAAADKKILGTALKGAREELRAHLFKAMSSRAVEMLKEDMDVMGPVRAKDVQKAQQQLLAVARQLESDGKIVLKVEADGELTA